MKAPQFFLGSVVMFWGWQVHTLWIATCVALILEYAPRAKSKFDFKISDFNKFVDISTVLLAGTIVIALTIDAQKAILILLKWLPLIFFPIIAAQKFSTKDKIDIQSFFLVARKKAKLHFYGTTKIDVSYIYSLFCILSAGTANTKGHNFYLCIVLFFVWALWQVRSKRSSLLLWGVCMIVVILGGYGTHKTIHRTSMKVTRWMMEYYADYYNTNPFKAYTSLGEIGDLKLYDKIILRVWFQDYIPGKTYLLNNATYNRFFRSSWYARHKFDSIEPGKDETFWQINPPQKNTKKMTIYFRPVKNKAVLSLPSGVVNISEMKAGGCEKNAMQSIRIEDTPALIKGVVSYDKLSYDTPPYDHDFLIPKKELPGIKKVVKELALENKPEEEILRIVKHYFLTEYTYSLDLKGKGKYKTPLQNFFNHTRSGHCEFFATATALILRQSKIPARYARGFVVHEYSRLENKLIVRQRDAHAWVKVFINGQWKNFDTTPPSFLQKDSQMITPSLVEDFLSFLGFRLSQLRHETGAKLMDEYGLWLTLPLGVILFFRLRKSNRIKRVRTSNNALEDKNLKNHCDSFYMIEDMLSKKGFSRYPYETYFSWFDRIGRLFDNKGIKDNLQAVLLLHNRFRFSKSGLKKDEKRNLESGVKAILKQLTTLS